jgi:diguanylate cyclase (GGDEF)-like protein
MRLPALSFATRRLILRVMTTLSLKMTLFYCVMFALASGLALLGTRAAIERYAEQAIRQEMATGSATFDRITKLHTDQLRQAGSVLSGDFGFREAAATADAPTIASALESLGGRMRLDHAMFVSIDGEVVGAPEEWTPAERDRLIDALDAGREEGVARWSGEAHIIAAAPVRAPVLIGWVVFARDMAPSDLRDLAGMLRMDLRPRLVTVRELPPDLRATLSTAGATVDRESAGQRLLLEARPVRSIAADEPQALVLEYSLTKAMAAYTPILLSLSGFGLLGMVVAAAGAWFASRRLARPIRALDAAARRVSLGEHARVAVETRDEIGRLARSFNTMVTDIAERERQIAHMAFHDALTGLANRALLHEHITMALQDDRRTGFALFCLDLDNFKAVNDTLGHPTGDALLSEVASRLSAACPGGFVARLGGDEFAIIVREKERTPAMVARAIIAAITEPFAVNGHRIVASTSIGIALAPQDGADATALLKNADLALYRAKNDGKSGFRFFEAEMDAEAQARRALEIDLHDALRNGELELHFQPLFNLAEDRVTAFEALLRWNHPRDGMISPVRFIPLAEETGLIIPIGEWALAEACRVAATWPDHVRVAVNISPVQFRSGALNGVILRALSASGLAPARLELEITESLFIENVEATLASLHSLRTLGVRVALDDFGTGYSSLSYLRSFPFDKLKIDRSFIIDLMADESAQAMIRAITGLAGALNMETTAEGVEHAEQVEILRRQGCSYIQGFYYSRPIPAAQVRTFLGMTPDQPAAASAVSSMQPVSSARAASRKPRTRSAARG